MFINEISSEQVWEGEKIIFDPDASLEAWEHYRKYYLCVFPDYDFINLFFYNFYSDVGLKSGYNYKGNWLNYTNIPKKIKPNRIFALNKSTSRKENDGTTYCLATQRLGGETDFNFNEQKVELFKKIIGEDSQILKQLTRCAEKHHTVINFSLMQAMGNMQREKGKNRFDRLDVFVLKLAKYFRGLSNNILGSSSDHNIGGLISFLDTFKDIYDYMEKTYFIDDTKFVDKIIKQGELPIETHKDVVRYMSLAEEFWDKKEFYLLKKEFLTIENYFNFDAAYSTQDLLFKIENNLGYDEEVGKKLIERCVERGFMIEASSDLYTR